MQTLTKNNINDLTSLVLLRAFGVNIEDAKKQMAHYYKFGDNWSYNNSATPGVAPYYDKSLFPDFVEKVYLAPGKKFMGKWL